ncbi:MAG: DUF1624 domain-containing protein [Bacilli bacterium]|nr:DUF1624 domain-containing protein [Bacilli bacterium]MBN2696342.1 DUF1624 domain-containing protein [Bacilli bacterium]
MESTRQARIWELDFLRGFAIIMMVFDHLMYDLKGLPSLFGNYFVVGNPAVEWLSDFADVYWYSSLRAGGHYVFVFLFLVVSGISFNFSRNNLRRSLRFLAVALVISAVTIGIEEISGGAYDFAIYFGIIHLFAVGTLLTLLVRKIWNNDLFLLSIGLVIVGLGVVLEFWKVEYYGSLDFGRFMMMILGFKGYGADYFGLAPFAGAIMVGSAIGKHIYPSKFSLLPKLDGKWNIPFTYCGRHAFMIFITHQLVLYFLIFAFGYIFGYRI